MDSETLINRDVVVIGASAGGVEALREIVRYLPADLAAAVFVVLHLPRDAPSQLPAILTRSGSLPAVHAMDGESIQAGRIYIAPPDHHMLVERGRVRVVQGPIENRHRPSIDPLFRAAARAYGPRVIGVILTGALDDGTAGLLTVKHAGGTAVVQDPEDALYPGMPRSALEYVNVDHCVSLAQIPALLAELVMTPIEVPALAAEEVNAEMTSEGSEYDQPPSAFTCPDCNGTLWEVREGELLRYQCRVGHAYSADSMVAAQDESVERALWAALRALEENADLAGRMAESARRRHSHGVATRFDERRAEAEQNGAVLRDLLIARLTTRGETTIVGENVERERS